ncbi:MAG TPA: nickel insertion protein [Steroidobacteraceae bacterium]|nr:nickel insertion protein [Steroidobacteraceae bacterium]
MDIHLNLAGGITGDMFIAALLDAFPHFEDPVISAIDALDAHYPVNCSLIAHCDSEVAGRRFEIEPFDRYFGYIPFASPVNSQGDSNVFERETWESVRANLDAAQVAPGIRSHAIRIFELIARAHAHNGHDLQKVVFDEVGAWESLAQVIGAAALIEALGQVRWSAAYRPRGEITTHAGAAIVDYLCPRAVGSRLPNLSALTRTGIGFRSARKAASGYLRVLCFDEGEAVLAGHPDATRAPKWIAERV